MNCYIWKNEVWYSIRLCTYLQCVFELLLYLMELLNMAMV
jgi:hypothetical protein